MFLGVLPRVLFVQQQINHWTKSVNNLACVTCVWMLIVNYANLNAIVQAQLMLYWIPTQCSYRPWQIYYYIILSSDILQPYLGRVRHNRLTIAGFPCIVFWSHQFLNQQFSAAVLSVGQLFNSRSSQTTLSAVVMKHGNAKTFSEWQLSLRWPVRFDSGMTL